MSISAMKAIQMVYANTTKHDWPDDIWDAICQAIEAEKHEVSQEPVALMVVNGEISYKSTDDDQSFGMWCPVNYDSSHSFPDGTKLYTHPKPKREPLTDEQIDALERICIDPVDANGWGFLNRKSFARAIEAAHGITSDMKQEHVDKTEKQRHEENT